MLLEQGMKSSDREIGWCRVAAACFVFSSVLVTAMTPLRAAERDFPFDQELLLDARPMVGTKRVPSLEIAANGAVSIDLWCDSVQGQIVVVEDTIAVLTGPRTKRPCSPQLAQNDEKMLTWLTQVTTWKRDGDGVLLIGPQNLRFRMPTN
jgi:heat shock protein HslJ